MEHQDSLQAVAAVRVVIHRRAVGAIDQAIETVIATKPDGQPLTIDELERAEWGHGANGEVYVRSYQEKNS